MGTSPPVSTLYIKPREMPRQVIENQVTSWNVQKGDWGMFGKEGDVKSEMDSWRFTMQMKAKHLPKSIFLLVRWSLWWRIDCSLMWCPTTEPITSRQKQKSARRNGCQSFSTPKRCHSIELLRTMGKLVKTKETNEVTNLFFFVFLVF